MSAANQLAALIANMFATVRVSLRCTTAGFSYFGATGVEFGLWLTGLRSVLVLGFAWRSVPAAPNAAGPQRPELRLWGRHALLPGRRADHRGARQTAVCVVPHSLFCFCDRIVALWGDGLNLIPAICCFCACAVTSPAWILTGSTPLCISSKEVVLGDYLVHTLLLNCMCNASRNVLVVFPFQRGNGAWNAIKMRGFKFVQWLIWLAKLILCDDRTGSVKYQFFTFCLGTVAIGSNCCVMRCGSDTCCLMSAPVTQLEKENFKFPCFKLCFESI